MPVSNPETKPWIMEHILKLQPKTVLDVGAGKGVYLNAIRQFMGKSVHVSAVEVWKPYVDFFSLKLRYDNVIQDDVRNIDNFKYDLVILGDVLEHMSAENAVSLWDKISKQAKYAVIAIPTVHMPQGAVNNNPYEVHVEEDWTPERVLSSFSNIVDHKVFTETSAFLAKF